MTADYKPDAWAKFNDWVIEDLEPQTLTSLRDSIASGETMHIERLYRTMVSRWPKLKKCLSEKASAVQSLSYNIVPWAARGEDPTPEAQALADLIEDALWTRDTTGQAQWRLSFFELIGSLTHAIARGLAVYQIQREYNKEMQAWLPVAYRPVLPSYYGWSTMAAEPDQLLFYPKGYMSGRGSVKAGGVEFPKDEFIIAMLKDGVDHPIFNAQLRALIGWYGAATFGLKWFMQYCRLFGIPFQHAKAHSDNRDKVKQFMTESLAAGFLVTGDDVSVEIVGASKGSSLPQKDMMELADNACAELILGQTLTSNQGDRGSQALGTVHNDVRSDFINAAASFVMEIVNTQLIPAIVRWNYGHDFGGQLPTLTLPEEKGTVERVDYIKKLLDLGVPMTKQFVHDFLDMPMPSESDDLFTPPSSLNAPLGFDEATASLRRPKLTPPHS